MNPHLTLEQMEKCELIAEIQKLQQRLAHKDLTLVTLCDMVLGEDAKDRSDKALIYGVGELKRRPQAQATNKASDDLCWLAGVNQDAIVEVPELWGEAMGIVRRYVATVLKCPPEKELCEEYRRINVTLGSLAKADDLGGETEKRLRARQQEILAMVSRTAQLSLQHDDAPAGDRCGFVPPTPGYAPCTRLKGHEGPCAHESLRGNDP